MKTTEKIMKRDSEMENELINRISNELKVMYVKEKLNNIGNEYSHFCNHILMSIEEGTYSFNDREGVMGEFNEYVCKLGYCSKEGKKAIERIVIMVKTNLICFIEEIEEELFQKLKITYPEVVNEYGKELLSKLEK